MVDPLEKRDTPWRDADALEELYVERQMSQAEIGERFGVTQRTISRWLERHGLDHPWRDEETMRELYVEWRLTMKEVGEKLNCGRQTVSKWLKKHGIETRSGAEVERRKPPVQRTTRRGYEVVAHQTGGESKRLRIHRLTAVAEYGFDAVEDKIVHHKNGIPWDNRPENLEPVTKEEHGKLHHPVQVRWGNSKPREHLRLK